MDILDRLGLKFDTLTEEEKNDYFSLLKVQEQQQISVSDFSKHITSMKNSVANELAELSIKDKEKNIHLKARLKNYILMEAFLLSPQKAREKLDAYLTKRTRGKN